MDHRWDESLKQARAAERDRDRRERPSPSAEAEVATRDRRRAEERRRSVGRSPWEIGAEHWDQRDLYTRNARTDDSGYARGPDLHPEVGSYAYARELEAHDAERRPTRRGLSHLYQREAWPWLNYEKEDVEREDDDVAVWRSVRDALVWRRDLDATEIAVAVAGGAVTLSGTVRDYASKRRAAETAAGCDGVTKVDNRLTIRRERREDPRDSGSPPLLPLQRA